METALGTLRHKMSQARRRCNPRRQLPLRRKPPNGTGPDGAIASVVGARWHRSSLYYACIFDVLLVLALPQIDQKVALNNVSENSAPAQGDGRGSYFCNFPRTLGLLNIRHMPSSHGARLLYA